MVLKKFLGKFSKSGDRQFKDDPGKVLLGTAVASAIVNSIGSKGIPMMGGSAQKAFQLSTDPNAEARDFIEVIESDEALSARVIKIANSVYFDRGTTSKTIEDSVHVIGINELRCLLSATTLSEIFPSKHAVRTLLWANDIATALIARHLATQLAPGKENLLFLGGLMHDIGKLLLLQRRVEDYQIILTSLEGEDIDFCTAETRLFAFDHTEVGLLIGERWRFTPEVNQMIRHHHDSWDSLIKSGISLPAIIKGADIIAHALALGHGRSLSRLQRMANSALPETWLALGISENDQRTVLSTAQRTFESEYDLYLGQRN